MDDRGFLDVQLVVEVLGHDLSLVGVSVADSEGIRPRLLRLRIDRDGRIRREGADLRDHALLHDRADGDIESAVVRAADRDDLVDFDEPPGRVDGVLRASADIVRHEFQRTTENAARRVDLLDREERSVPFMGSPRRPFAGQRRQIADLDRLRGPGRSEKHPEQTRNDEHSHDLSHH